LQVVPFQNAYATGGSRMLTKGAAVPLHVAGELADVEVGTIRRWAQLGSLEIEDRGDMEVVRLDRVLYLAESSDGRSDPRMTLRALLHGTKTDTVGVVDLQEHARESSPDRP
jgi:hypothetical protein